MVVCLIADARGSEHVVSLATNSAAGTPLWLGVLTLLIAISAVGVSYWQGRATVREQRRIRPNISISVEFHNNIVGATEGVIRGFIVSVANTGREDSEVESIIIASARTILNGQNLIVGGGSVIPYRLQGHSAVSWIIDGRQFPEDEAVVTVRLGHGEVVERTVTIGAMQDEQTGRTWWRLGRSTEKH
ncbi:MAG: hypothetical protein ABSC00_08970 [Acidimicrobiales bacterium]